MPTHAISITIVPIGTNDQAQNSAPGKRIAVSTPLHMLGVSFAMLRRLRLVPTPAPAAEAAAEVAAPEPPTAAPLLHRHAA